MTVELLTAYSHSTQAADLRLCRTEALTSPVRAATPSAQRPWSLRERLDEHEITELITGYRNGAAASVATAHGVSLSSIRFLYTAGVRRTPSTRVAVLTRDQLERQIEAAIGEGVGYLDGLDQAAAHDPQLLPWLEQILVAARGHRTPAAPTHRAPLIVHRRLTKWVFVNLW